MIETIQIDATVQCELSVECSPHCPIKDEEDRYQVRVEWLTECATFEKHDLRDYIKGFDGKELTQEALCEKIYSQLDDDIDATVVVQDIAHMDMEVSKP